jgi:hypothetical protein
MSLTRPREASDLPPVFDRVFYCSHHVDLQQVADLRGHYEAFGRAEGRPTSAACFRETFITYLSAKPSVLEIGPFCNPVVRGPNVRYCDVLDTSGLIERAKRIGYPIISAPYIDYVSPTGDLSGIDDQFAAVISVHCIEHQPDLVRHLTQVSELLCDGGQYFLVIPDKRYCFDHFLKESTIADVIGAHIDKRTIHTLTSVIEHRALTTHNDTIRHWNGDHENVDRCASIANRTSAAMAEFNAADGSYVDVHAWQFTPDSFRAILGDLYSLQMTDLIIERAYPTPRGRNEFMAVLGKPVA